MATPIRRRGSAVVLAKPVVTIPVVALKKAVTRRGPKRHSPEKAAAIKEKIAAIIPKVTMSRAQAVTKKYEDKVNNRKSAIRAHCIGCSGGSYVEVRECPVTTCALYPFREGKDPFRAARAKARQESQTEIFGEADDDEENENDDAEE